jgi:hypothetical protein
MIGGEPYTLGLFDTAGEFSNKYLPPTFLASIQKQMHHILLLKSLKETNQVLRTLLLR